MVLFDRLPQIGFVERKNLIVDRYATEGRPERYAEVARNIVQAKPDVIALDCAATEAAFWIATRTTLVGSMMPLVTRLPYSPVCESKP